MMLTSDAFLGGAGEMERLRSTSLSQSANSKKANTEPQGTAMDASFSEVLQDVQEATDSAGVSGTAAEAAETSDVSEKAPLIVEEKGSSKIEDAVSKKEQLAEDEGAMSTRADALYVKLFADDAAKVDAPIAVEVADIHLDVGEDDNLSSIITAIAADSDDVLDDSRAIVAGSESDAFNKATGLDERAVLAKSAADDAAAIDAEKSALDANLSSINIEENDAAVVASADDALDGAFAARLEAAQAGKAKLERASFAQEGAQNVAAAGQGRLEAQEDAAITVADFRTEARVGAGKANAARNAEQAADTPTVPQAGGAVADSTAQFGADFSFEGDGLLGKEGFSSSGISLQGARGGEGAAGGTQGGAATSFAERLASELRNNAADIVRAGQVILRNGGEGTIRLALHPETLGAVRIHLEMTGEKKIAGRITVASREAWDAFSDSMDSLIAAFSDEGFDTAAGFDLSWAGRGAGSEAGGKISAPFYASATPDVMPAEDFADDYSTAAARRSRGSLYSVNLLA